MYKQTNVEKIKELIDKGATDADWTKAKNELEAEREERERQTKEAAERHRLWLIEQSKPENFIPKQSKYMHVPENFAEFKKLCQSCDLESLKQYCIEIAEGAHSAELATVNTTKVVQFLLAQIALRKDDTEAPAAKTEIHKKDNKSLPYSR
jgi:hypothetical protein